MKALLFAFLLFTPSAFAQDVSTIEKQVGPSVVRLYTRYATTGSGFVVMGISGNKIIITNQHVCRKADTTISVEFTTTGKISMEQVVAIYPESDLCVVRLTDQSSPALSLANALNSNETVYALGHPFGAPLTTTTGKIEGKTDDPSEYPARYCTPQERLIKKSWGTVCIRQIIRIIFSAVVNGGNSGGPLVNNAGSVTGVVTEKNILGGGAVPMPYVFEVVLKH